MVKTLVCELVSMVRPKSRRNGNKQGAGFRAAVLSCLFAWQAGTTYAAEPAAIDCPLRDAPYSANTPVIDLMLNAAAKAVVEQQFPGIFARLPAHMLRTETPSFGAIVSVENLLSMMRIPTQGLEQLDKKLAAVPLTEQDRIARCARFDNDDPQLILMDEEVQVLVFHKITGFDHGPSVTAATDAIKKLAGELGWGVAVTDKGGAFTPETLSRFDAVIWNNVSGDALTLKQRQAFQDYIHQGGGFLGIHGSGGDSIYYWDWYADTLLGAQFIGHPMQPQFQDAEVRIEANPGDIAASLAPGWRMKDEWYSFKESPRSQEVNVVATLDEATYIAEGYGGQDLRMGDDHPIVWTRCVGAGRSFYTAIGHRPEVYQLIENMTLLKDGLVWTAGKGSSRCPSNR